MTALRRTVSAVGGLVRFGSSTSHREEAVTGTDAAMPAQALRLLGIA